MAIDETRKLAAITQYRTVFCMISFSPNIVMHLIEVATSGSRLHFRKQVQNLFDLHQRQQSKRQCGNLPCPLWGI